MTIKKKEFFKRKNHNNIYRIYENAVSDLSNITEQFNGKLNTIRKLKNQYKNSEHIYHLLDAMENDMSNGFYSCPFYEGQLIKSSNFIVDVKVYQYLNLYIERLTRGVGTMESLINTLTYFERNELGVRSK